MKYKLLRALAKKHKFFGFTKNINDISSDEDLTSDDESDISKNIIYTPINNRYIIIKYLGRGTFCRTWLTYDLEDDKFVATKICFKEFYDEMFNEIEINKKITNNSNIVKLLDSFIINKQHYLIYELMGMNLLEIQNIYDNKIPLNLIKNILRQVFSGLNDLHNMNIIHCDLKCENIMIKQPNSYVSKIINLLESLKLKEKFNSIINENIPENYYNYNKTKRKNIKRKIKIKSIKEVIDIIKCNIETLNFEYDLKKNNILEENVICKIIDLGNSEIIGETEQDEIMIRYYRPPENIMNNFYNEKADIWSMGCIIYEIFTNEYLFDLDKNLPKNEKDREHLLEMYRLLGKIPKEYTLNCDFSETLFDNQGRIKNKKNFEPKNLQEILNDYVSNDLSIKLTIFLKKILDYNLEKRPSALQLMNDEFLIN